MKRSLIACLFALMSMPSAAAQSPDQPVSQCLAVAQEINRDFHVRYASTAGSMLDITRESVTLKFEGHATWRITTPSGLEIVTDYFGAYGSDPLPNVVTMNRAHTTHFTLSPEPGIGTVLHGWSAENPDGIDHDVVIDDVYIRNVTTDMRSFGLSRMMANQNSIFIFETADLCIGHLGPLQHALTTDHYAEIGRLDIVMVPVDGGLTMSHQAMAEMTRRLRSSIVLPMHLSGHSFSAFRAMMGDDWQTVFLDGDTLEISIDTLPRQPTIMVPAGLATRG